MLRTVRRMAGVLSVILVGACAGEMGPAGQEGDPSLTEIEPLLDRIIYVSIHPDSMYTRGAGIWTRAKDGSDPRLLIGGFQWPASPSLSPDGKHVVFEDQWRLYTVDADGANLATLPLPAGARAMHPKWSPDGTAILFTFQDGIGARNRIYRVAPDGSSLTPLTSPGASDSWGANWSPDGGSIVFVRETFDTITFVPTKWIVTLDVGTLAETVLIDSAQGFTGYFPSWSPDGSALYFLDVGPDPAAPWTSDWFIGRYDAGTGDYTPLGSAEGNRPPTLSPDGSTLLFGTGEFWTAAPDGSVRTPIVNDGRLNFEVFWTPAAPAP